MKLIINYDLMNAICNVNEPLTLFKIIRNSKVRYLTFNIPWCLFLDFLMGPGSFGFLGTLGLQMGLIGMGDTGLDLLYKNIYGVDQYARKSTLDLKKLVVQLEDLQVSTDYNLLLESKVYQKNYKVEISKNQLPHIAESKYILVPSYTYSGDRTDTSLLQEHIVGSKEYVLSLGSPKRVFKPAYSNT